MNTTIKTFDFKSDAGELLASVRTLLINNVPWFVAADVALALGYSQTQAMTKLIDDEDKDNQTILIGCNYTNQSVINESGLYTAIMGSRKKQAKRFKRWVTADVLPSIRATGSYSLTPSNDLPDFQMKWLLPAHGQTNVKLPVEHLDTSSARQSISSTSKTFFSRVCLLASSVSS
ncbi:BRO-N domain-containing protein [Citrobacter youngae]|uniref:BRO-N domain-containing protein n=1 Tax=Citrobacter youngae TaxID=133448 RepID=UPI000E1AF092|nr:Uncharacterized phage-encoded protein [Citrobacter youngae]